ncbi:MAG: serine/threonine-protein kinase [Polyangiales bacterium]
MARVGGTINSKYSLQRALGLGGMGEVFAAQNLWTGRAVAIKTLRAEYAKERQFVERFWQEARCASALRHRNIVDVLDVGVDDATGEPFIVMEYLEGRSLDRALADAPDHRLPAAAALLAVLPVMDALATCHEAGLIHRDVKPSNVILSRAPDGEVVPKLIDFGVSKSLVQRGPARTVSGSAVGTPQYMAPEQARGEDGVDGRADVWAVGATLFESLAGRLPFDGPSVHVIVAQIMNADAPPLRSLAPEVPADVAAAVDRALQRDPRRRFGTMREFLGALLACEVTRTAVAPASPQLARLRVSRPDAVTAADGPVTAPERPTGDDLDVTADVLPPPLLRVTPQRLRLIAGTAVFTFAFVVALSALGGRAPAPRPLTPTPVPRLTPPARSPLEAPPPEPPPASPAPPIAPPSRTETPAAPAPVARRIAPTARRIAPPPRPAPAPAANPLAPDERPYAEIRRRGAR